jgi:serine/threonine-protein kinase
MSPFLAKLRLGTVIAGRYRLDSIIGEGGMGVVYQGTHVHTRRAVAVKLLDATRASDHDSAKRFSQEARAAVRLEHPNVVQVLDMGEVGDGALYLALELLRGETLQQHLKKHTTLSLGEVSAFLFPIMSAVAAAHRLGLVHRDLKPANIFLSREQDQVVPKLLDFGIVKDTLGGDSLVMTRTGVIMGTPRYMAPEQVEADHETSPATDVWSMGVVLYESLTGSALFPGENPASVLVSITTGYFTPIHKVAPKLASAIADAIERAIRVDPRQRYRDMGAFLDALTEAFSRAGIEGSEDGPSVLEAPTNPKAIEKETIGPEVPTMHDPRARAARVVIERAREPQRDTVHMRTIAAPETPAPKSILKPNPAPKQRGIAPAVLLVGVAGAIAIVGLATSERWSKAPAHDEPLQAPAIAKTATRAESKPDASEDPERDPHWTAALEAKGIAMAALKECDRYRRDLEARVQKMETQDPGGADFVKAAKKRCDETLFGGSDWLKGQGKLALADELMRAHQYPGAIKEYQEATEIEQTVLHWCRKAVEDPREVALFEDGGPKKHALEHEPEKTEPTSPPKPAAKPVSPADKSRAKAHYETAVKMKSQARIDDAIAEYTQAIRLVPDFVVAYNGRGLAYEEIHRLDKAIADFNRAIDLDPNNAPLYNNRGIARRSANDPAGAITDFSRAIDLDRSQALFYQHRADTKLQIKDIDGAIEDLTKVIAREPKNAAAYYARGVAHEDRSDHLHAEADFTRVLELTPERTEAYYLRGVARSELGNPDGAIKDFDGAIRRNPGHAPAHLGRGLAEVKLGRAKEARADLARYLELDPNTRRKREVEKLLHQLKAN